MNDPHAKRRCLLPDLSSVVQRYKCRRRPRADSGHQTMQADRHSARSLSSDDGTSVRSACSGMTPLPTASLAAESGMSVRLGRYHVGTPVSYRLTPSSSSSTTTTTTTDSRRASFFSRQWRQGSAIPSIANSWRIRRTIEDQPLPDFETQVFCPTCEKWVQSRIRYRLGALTWLVALILFACTVFLFWVPFYVKYFKDVVHYCPACGTNVGRHSKL